MSDDGVVASDVPPRYLFIMGNMKVGKENCASCMAQKFTLFHSIVGGTETTCVVQSTMGLV